MVVPTLRALIVLLTLLPLASRGFAHIYYVSPIGNDASSGLQGAPWKTIRHAAAAAVAGDIVKIQAGTYAGEITQTTNGTVAAQITFQGLPGVKLVQSASDTSGAAVTLRGANVVWAGTEIDGTTVPAGASPWYMGVYATGTNDVVEGNTIHNIAATLCNDQGAGGIVTDHYFGGTNISVLHNVVYNIGPSTPCNVDQGIYPGTSGRIAFNHSYNNSGWGIVTYHDATDVTIEYNEVNGDGSESGGIAVGCGGFYTLTTCDHFIVKGNYVHDEPNIGLNGSTSYTYIGHNSYFIDNRLENVRYGCVDIDLANTEKQRCPPNP